MLTQVARIKSSGPCHGHGKSQLNFVESSSHRKYPPQTKTSHNGVLLTYGSTWRNNIGDLYITFFPKKWACSFDCWWVGLRNSWCGIPGGETFGWVHILRPESTWASWGSGKRKHCVIGILYNCWSLTDARGGWSNFQALKKTSPCLPSVQLFHVSA